MSMENGFELDFPGEPDAASNDEMPVPMVTLDQVMAEAANYWERTDVSISRAEGNATFKMSFVTDTGRGTDTTTVRLTQGEMIRTWYAIGNYLGLMPR